MYLNVFVSLCLRVSLSLCLRVNYTSYTTREDSRGSKSNAKVHFFGWLMPGNGYDLLNINQLVPLGN